jgi:hypothetical protein
LGKKEGAGVAWLFETTDPQGRTVRLSEERWQQHILARRSFLKNFLQDIQEAIERPQAIHQGNRPFTLVYTGQPFPSGFHKGETIRAVTRFNRAYRYGEILTAYVTSQDYQGALVWTP